MNAPEIVAELSGNHGGSLQRARDLVNAAADAGADAVKLQCWTPGTMVLGSSAPLTSGPWVGQTPASIYDAAQTPWHWFEELFDLARSRGIKPFASVFDRDALRFLQKIGCERYKIASAELVDLPLIRLVASTGKPIVISTGMGTREEIHDALETAMAAGSPSITLLHCVSVYPMDPAAANLATMLDLAQRYRGRCAVGFSDHSLNIGTAVAASAHGARMIEKHLTLLATAIDGTFSLFPDEFKRMGVACRQAYQAFGNVVYGPREGDYTALRRSLHAKVGIKAGEILTTDNVVTARPADGLPPKMLAQILSTRAVATRDLQPGDPITVAASTVAQEE